MGATRLNLGGADAEMGAMKRRDNVPRTLNYQGESSDGARKRSQEGHRRRPTIGTRRGVSVLSR